MAPSVKSLHRATRLILETTGEREIEKARAHLERLAVQVVVGDRVADSEAMDSALLTLINAGRRTFLGGVYVVGIGAARTRTPLASTDSLLEAAISYGAAPLDAPRPDLPVITLGDGRTWPASVPVAVRIELNGWTAAVVPARDPRVLRDGDALPLAGIFGAALALSEVFVFAAGLEPDAGHRELGLSLWTLDPTHDWRTAPPGPPVAYLPSNLRVIGLGHLGQGYLWALASLPYANPHDVCLTIQDDDAVGLETISTGLLTTSLDLDVTKTRVASAWLERRQFRTRLIERRFHDGDQVVDSDPTLILAGLDTAMARAGVATAVERRSGVQLLDLGLGTSTADFDDILLHAMPPADKEIARWTAAADRLPKRTEAVAESDRYQEIAAKSALDACGVLRLAELAVGVPYVGAAAGAVAIAEVLRRLAGETPTRSLGLHLRHLPLAMRPTRLSGAIPPIAFVRAS